MIRDALSKFIMIRYLKFYKCTYLVYSRWSQAKDSWTRIHSMCANTCRQGTVSSIPLHLSIPIRHIHNIYILQAYLADQRDKEDYVHRVISLAYIFKRHFRNQNCKKEDTKLQSKLIEFLGEKESERLMASKNRPMAAITDLSHSIRYIQLINYYCINMECI